MNNITAEQFEALETLAEFNSRLIKNLPTIAEELTGEKQPDTDQYLKNIIDAINWEISVVNATLEVLNEGQTRVDKESFNQKVQALGSALSGKIDAEIAVALKELIPCFTQLEEAVSEVLK